MAVREEVQAVILKAGILALENACGEITRDDVQRLHRNLKERIPQYTGRYPLIDLRNVVQETADAISSAPSAKAATCTAINRKSDKPDAGFWDEAENKPGTPIEGRWGSAIRESADNATEEYFGKARGFFKNGNPLRGTEYLRSGIVCSIAAVAALRQWPHADADDDLNAVVALGAGKLPENDRQIYELLNSASEDGRALNSAFAAAMGQPDNIRAGMFYDSATGSDEDAVLFAERTVELIKRITGE